MSKRFFIIIPVLVLAVGVGAYIWYANASEDSVAGEIAPAAGEMAMPVSVLELQKQAVSIPHSLPGRISAFKQSQVRPQVNGIITERLFEEGANVELGQQLYQIDDARYKAALASTEADLKSAQSNINSIKLRTNRYKELVKIDAVSRQEYDDVKAQLDQAIASVAVAEAAVKVAQVNLDYTKVYAPISGRIGRSLVTEGALVTANQSEPMAVITMLDPVYVDMQQSGNEAMKLRAELGGQETIPVTLMLGEDNTVPYGEKGTLKFSEVTIDETTGSITLRAVIPNPNDVLLPGLFVRATLNMDAQSALLVPQRAATRNPDGGLTVWVVDAENKANPHAIKVSAAYQDSWIVSEGVEAGDKIVVEGYQKIGPGALVSPSPWGGDASASVQETLSDNTGE